MKRIDATNLRRCEACLGRGFYDKRTPCAKCNSFGWVTDNKQPVAGIPEHVKAAMARPHGRKKRR